MAYDEELADRIRELLSAEEKVTEKKMFGGLAFLVSGNMAIAASGQGGILVRSDPKKAVPKGAEPAIMRGRPMDGWLRVDDSHIKTNAQLAKWARLAVGYAGLLPPKSRRRRRRATVLEPGAQGCDLKSQPSRARWAQRGGPLRYEEFAADLGSACRAREIDCSLSDEL